MFQYTLNVINDLESSISSSRLSTYLTAAAGNKEKALNLYLKNSKLSASFYLPLQGLEISLRNALHQSLAQKFQSEEWYDQAPLDLWGNKMVQDAKNKAMRDYGRADFPHVIAELSFGFWSSLMNKNYHQSLWIPALGKAFPHAHLPRSDIHHQLNHIRTLRNRIAHHEPIFSRHMAEDYKTIIKLISWINPSKAKWIDHHNQVLKTIGEN